MTPPGLSASSAYGPLSPTSSTRSHSAVSDTPDDGTRQNAASQIFLIADARQIVTRTVERILAANGEPIARTSRNNPGQFCVHQANRDPGDRSGGAINHSRNRSARRLRTTGRDWHQPAQSGTHHGHALPVRPDAPSPSVRRRQNPFGPRICLSAHPLPCPCRAGTRPPSRQSPERRRPPPRHRTVCAAGSPRSP